jgi:CO/xanthine dehydrogenase Mo-binding subunit/aerobic-type carbon monoxide dehydrogenase small subunit (CoxS/CutS family)
MVHLIPIELTVNSKKTTLEVSPETNLMKILREQLHLTGTKCGCGEGTCGTCTVILNGKAVRSCVIKPDKLESANIETIEGLQSGDVLHPIQEAFIERQGSQCGFCTPGMIMSAKALLDNTPKPTEDDIKNALRINICRCTGYEQVIEAVQQAAGILQSNESTNRMIIVGPKEERNWIGKSVPRTDAKEFITGKALFTEDLPDPEGTLFLSTKRSEKAHANIKSIDYSEAVKIPGVVRVITAKDIPGENSYGKIIRDIPVLASDKVRSYADAVALVVAESYEIAQLGCEAIRIEYEELPAVFDSEKSLEPNSPQIHPKGNLLYEFDIIKGDVDKGFEECDVIVEEEFSTPRVDHGQMEPEAALAYFDDNLKLCVKAPTQHVFFDRLNIIRALGVPKDDVRVIQPPVGGAFGKREDVYGQIHCALGAFLTKRPVRTVYSREETFEFTQKRHPTRIRIKVGAKKNGQILAFKADVLSDTGAYASWGQNILRKICVHVSGPYEIPNVRVNGRSVYTNNIFCGAMRGFGTPQAVFASESALDILAEKLQIDRVEIRKINSLKPGSKTATGQIVTNTPGRQTIELAAKQINWNKEFSKIDNENNKLKRGRGVASLWYGIGFGAGIPDQGNAIVEITSEGKAKVFVSTVDYGQGSNTIFPQIAAETLGLNITDIIMVTGDSDTTPNCGSTVATRQTFITGNAINNACNKIADDIKEIAAIKLNTSINDIQLSNNIASQIKNRSNKILVSDILTSFEEFGRPRRREAFFKGEKYTQHLDPKTGQGNAYHPIAYGTQIAEVSVDTTTGKVKLEKIVACHYIGKALNPESVRGQILGGISMGWGYALTEDSIDSEGRCLADNFGKYKMMRATDTPEYNVILLEDPEPTGPYGAIGIGEPPTVAAAPAIINAIYDAIGVRITSLPATPEKILTALNSKTK